MVSIMSYGMLKHNIINKVRVIKEDDSLDLLIIIFKSSSLSSRTLFSYTTNELMEIRKYIFLYQQTDIYKYIFLKLLTKLSI